MQDTIQGLYVTVVGMGLLFVSLGLLMACIALLTRIFPAKEQGSASGGDADTPDKPAEVADADAGADAGGMGARVAAIAVSLALAEQDHLPRIPRPAHPAGGTVGDAWVILGRQAGMASHRPR